MVTNDGIETEVKFRIDSTRPIEEKLKSLGAKFIESGLEKNIKFGKKDITDEKEWLKLKLRSFCGKVSIIQKEMPENASDEFKVRDEIEIHVDNFDDARNLLERLGYKAKWRYEKKKQLWVLDGVDIFIDTMPLIGQFIEIEAPQEEIRKAAKKLGLDMKDSIVDGYGNLYKKYRKEHKLPKGDLVFPEGEK
jgi:adenylate cyclase, class 2